MSPPGATIPSVQPAPLFPRLALPPHSRSLQGPPPPKLNKSKPFKINRRCEAVERQYPEWNQQDTDKQKPRGRGRSTGEIISYIHRCFRASSDSSQEQSKWSPLTTHCSQLATHSRQGRTFPFFSLACYRPALARQASHQNPARLNEPTMQQHRTSSTRDKETGCPLTK